MHSLSVKRARKESGGRRGKEGAAAALFRLKRKRAKEGEERAFALAPISVIVVVAAASSVRVPRMGPSLVHSPLEIRSPSRYQDVPRIGGWRRRTANGNGAGRQTPGVEDQCDRISGAVGWWRGSLPLSKFFKIRICELRIRHDEVCTLFIIE